MKKLFIAGHDGMVGAALVREAESSRRFQVVTATREQLDLCDPHHVFAFLSAKKPDVVINAAICPGISPENPTSPSNPPYKDLGISANLIEGCRRADIQRLLSLVAPAPDKRHNAKTASGLAGCTLCRHYRSRHGLIYHSATIPDHLYGPDGGGAPRNSSIIQSLLRRFHDAAIRCDSSMTLHNTSAEPRGYLHVDDFAAACFHLLEMDSPPDWVAISSSEALTLRDLAAQLAETVGFTGEILALPLETETGPTNLVDICHIQNTGWRPKIPLENGIAATYGDFLVNRHREKLKKTLEIVESQRMTTREAGDFSCADSDQRSCSESHPGKLFSVKAAPN